MDKQSSLVVLVGGFIAGSQYAGRRKCQLTCQPIALSRYSASALCRQHFATGIMHQPTAGQAGALIGDIQQQCNLTHYKTSNHNLCANLYYT